MCVCVWGCHLKLFISFMSKQKLSLCNKRSGDGVGIKPALPRNKQAILLFSRTTTLSELLQRAHASCCRTFMIIDFRVLCHWAKRSDCLQSKYCCRLGLKEREARRAESFFDFMIRVKQSSFVGFLRWRAYISNIWCRATLRMIILLS